MSKKIYKIYKYFYKKKGVIKKNRFGISQPPKRKNTVVIEKKNK